MAKSKKAMKRAILPKSIAGMKVPKQLRRRSGSLAQVLETPLGREVVAHALVAAAGSLIGSERVQHALRSGGRAATHGGSDVLHALKDAVETTSGAIGQAAKHMVSASSSPHGQPDDDAPVIPDDEPLRHDGNADKDKGRRR